MRLSDKIRAMIPEDSGELKMSTRAMVEDTLTMAAQRNRRGGVRLRFNSYSEARLTAEWLTEEGFDVVATEIGQQLMLTVKF